VNRLKLYKSKLVIFPRKPTSKRAKKGDSSKDERKQVAQVANKDVLAIVQPKRKIRARKITSTERDTATYSVLRKARTDAQRWGAREKRAKDKAAEAAGKGKAKGETTEAMDE